MRILVVADVLGEVNNGTSLAAYNIIEALKKRGHEVRVLCGDQTKKGLPGYYVCPTMNFFIFNAYMRKNGVAPAKADLEIINEALDGVDLVHCMLPFSAANHAAKIADERNIPITAGFHMQAENLTSHFHAQKMTWPNKKIYKFIYNKLYHCVDAIHYPTQFIKEDFEKAVGPTNGYVISNGVKDKFHRMEVKKDSDKFTILYTGRYSREKYQKLLINAMRHTKHKDEIQLIFAGSGPMKRKLEKKARFLKNKPIFKSFSQDEMPEMINKCDLYVHCAYAELESIACLEAISCGLVPVINNTKRVATKYFAIDEKNLFKCNSSSDLASKIDYWIEHPLERKKRSNEYLNFTKRFEFEHCMDRMEKMMLEAVKIRQYKVENGFKNRVIYYNDPINEDFAGTTIENRKVGDDFIYIHRNKMWRALSNILYRGIARPFIRLFCRWNSKVKVKNPKVIKPLKKSGYFLYGNHTSFYDAVTPQTMVNKKKKTYLVASSDAVSIQGIKNIVMMLGALPLPGTPKSTKNFLEAIEFRYRQNRVIAIYPEAHIWPGYTGVRPFGNLSFQYPAMLNAPVVAMVMTYRPRKGKNALKKKPKIDITLSEPIYPQPDFSIKENMVYLHDQVYDFMVKTTSLAPKVDYIHYIEAPEGSTKYEK